MNDKKFENVLSGKSFWYKEIILYLISDTHEGLRADNRKIFQKCIGVLLLSLILFFQRQKKLDNI